MNCPGSDVCEAQEYHGCRNCSDASGQCVNEPRHVPASSVPTDTVEGEGLPEMDGRGGALLLMLAIVVACVLMGD
jgi:hypothetical protein